jgi:putative colanic acid biosynthesis acetyltransferase WcaF
LKHESEFLLSPFSISQFLMKVDLSSYSSAEFDRGAGKFRELSWLLVSLLLFRLCPFSLSKVKRVVLRAFGATIGRDVTIKPQVKITFPWKLTVGDHVWLGEESWLLNLERITIGNNVCISQRAFLCTGSHNYKVPSFDLIVKPIVLEDGCWIGACGWVGPGVTAGDHAVLAAGSVASRNLEPYGIYQGNPASLVRRRVFPADVPTSNFEATVSEPSKGILVHP